MADTDVDLAAFTTVLGECREAIRAGSWGTAWTRYAEAEAINARLELVTQHRNGRLQRRESLVGLGKALETAQAASAHAGDTRRLVGTRMGSGY